MKPKYKHDCNSCVFLGGYVSYYGEYKKTDLYFCPPSNVIVERFSDEGSDYRSHNLTTGLLYHQNTRRPWIKECIARGVKKGIITGEHLVDALKLWDSCEDLYD